MNQTLEKVITGHEARIWRIARQYARGDDCQDLVQEICLALWRGLDGFEGRSSLSTWVYRVAVNTALQFVRKRRLPTAPLVEEPPGSLNAGDPMDVLTRFLASLNPVNRAVLLLDLEGLHRDEVAEVLGLTPGAVAVRMTRLRQQFADDYLEED